MTSPAPESSTPMWLVWSAEHQLWWRPNSSGYTGDVKQAGRYTFAKALSICDTRNSGEIYPHAVRQGVPDEFPVPAPEYFDRIRELDKPAPAPAPASCSEVVERLRDECVLTVNGFATIDRNRATAILHEWREQIRKADD